MAKHDSDEPKPGSNAYALQAASYYEATASRLDTIEFSFTDLNLAAKWARYFAARWHRRAAYAAVLAIVGTLGVGLPDVDGDGRASLADLGVAMRHAVGALSPAAAAAVRHADH